MTKCSIEQSLVRIAIIIEFHIGKLIHFNSRRNGSIVIISYIIRKLSHRQEKYLVFFFF